MGSSCSPQAHPDFYLIGEQEQVSRKTCGVLRTEMLQWEQKCSVTNPPLVPGLVPGPLVWWWLHEVDHLA